MRAHLQETIGKARQAHAESLESYLARVTGLEGEPLRQEVERVMGIVEGIPQLMERVNEVAMRRGVGLLVQPLLEHAADYFRDPADHAPEVAYGVTGLLDDAYLALSVVALVHDSFEQMVDVDVPGQVATLRRLLEPDLVERLDAEVGRAILKLARTVAGLRERSSLDVDFFLERR